MTRGIHKLTRSFYSRPTLTVAREILGKFIVYHTTEGKLSGRIVEVEAYIGEDDPACHAARGLTERNAVMFGPPGFSYIYFIYGMYHCLNFVTEKKGFAAAILLRAAEPDEGAAIMKKHSPKAARKIDLLNGPGKFCRSFGLTRRQNGLDLIGDTLYLEDRDGPKVTIGQSRRIGIRDGRDKLWRFFDRDSRALTRFPK
ncbi:MAG: DNA-3-methyladenine glycosylase [Candidatus Zixiibacteriota bacterium]